MAHHTPSSVTPSSVGPVCVWTNPDTVLTLRVREADGTYGCDDITAALGVLVAAALESNPAHPDSAENDSADDDADNDSVDNGSGVELGSIELTGSVRVTVDGKRLSEASVLALCSEGIAAVLRSHVRHLNDAPSGRPGDHPDTKESP
jgi:hypothetical protein